MKKTLKRNVKNRRTLRRVLKGGATQITPLMAAMIIQRRLAQELDCNESAPGFFGCKSGCQKIDTYTQIVNKRGFYEVERLPNPIKRCSSNKPLSTAGNIYTVYVVTQVERQVYEPILTLVIEDDLSMEDLVSIIQEEPITQSFIERRNYKVTRNSVNVELTSEEIAKYKPMAEKLIEFSQSLIRQKQQNEEQRRIQEQEEARRRWNEEAPLRAAAEARYQAEQKQREAEKDRKYIEEQARLRLQKPHLEEAIAQRMIELKQFQGSSGV